MEFNNDTKIVDLNKFLIKDIYVYSDDELKKAVEKGFTEKANAYHGFCIAIERISLFLLMKKSAVTREKRGKLTIKLENLNHKI